MDFIPKSKEREFELPFESPKHVSPIFWIIYGKFILWILLKAQEPPFNTFRHLICRKVSASDFWSKISRFSLRSLQTWSYPSVMKCFQHFVLARSKLFGKCYCSLSWTLWVKYLKLNLETVFIRIIGYLNYLPCIGINWMLMCIKLWWLWTTKSPKVVKIFGVVYCLIQRTLVEGKISLIMLGQTWLCMLS